MGEDSRQTPRESPRGRRQKAHALRRRHRQPVGQDDGKRGVRGYDAGKKINGRKRHILVDTIGLLLLVTVLPANLQDRDGARQLLASFFSQCQSMRRRVRHIWADGGYAGTLVQWTLNLWRCTLEIVKRNELHTFKVLPRRWVVERTFGWLGRYRRLNRDYERQAKTGETMVYLAMIRLMLARLGRT